jgi:GDP-L-fucose synthase
MVMSKDAKIYVAGHSGLLGSALVAKLSEKGYGSIITRPHRELELTDRRAVFDFFSDVRPEYVFLAAGKVGGILSNVKYPAEYLHTNVALQDNVFEAAVKYKVRHLVFYGSSCIYPKLASQPIKEEYLLTGPIEETSQSYAIAKIAGVTACRAYNQQHRTNCFIALVPNSAYGPHDDFNTDSAHVLSALVCKFYEAKATGAKVVTLWGSGAPRREFIFSEDVAEASLFAVDRADELENSHYNIGTGIDYSIKELASLVAATVGYEGAVAWDTAKPDGAARKLLDSSRFLALGWKPRFNLDAGLKITCEWYKRNWVLS